MGPSSVASSSGDGPASFVPKSNAKLLPGHFWPIPLQDGQFSAGVVLDVPSEVVLPRHAGSRRACVVGLLDWHGAGVPDARVLSDVPLLECGMAHIKSIALTSGGRGIVGQLATLPPALAYLSHRSGPGVWGLVNGRPDHAATAEERAKLGVWGTWGLTYIQGLADELFGTKPAA